MPKTPRTFFQRTSKHEIREENDKGGSFIPSQATQDAGYARYEVITLFQLENTPYSSMPNATEGFKPQEHKEYNKNHPKEARVSFWKVGG